MKKLLDIKDLYTIAEDDHNKKILNGLNLTINEGEVHVIMGPNGSGKSTLANTCFNSPKYITTKGEIIFDGEDIIDKSPDYISKKGIFMSFQNPEEIPGVSLANFLKTIRKAKTNEKINIASFYKEVNEYMDQLGMDRSYAQRELNVGFSGGEKKKTEILQMLILDPKLVILDETDSGLDVDAIKVVSKGLDLYKNENNSILIITHTPSIIKNLKVDKVHILINGKIVKTGDVSLADEIFKNGYKDYINEEN